MKRASYRDAVDWIAHNDGLGDDDALDPYAVAAMVSVCLVADMFGVGRRKVGSDVVELRRKKKLT